MACLTLPAEIYRMSWSAAMEARMLPDWLRALQAIGQCHTQAEAPGAATSLPLGKAVLECSMSCITAWFLPAVEWHLAHPAEAPVVSREVSHETCRYMTRSNDTCYHGAIRVQSSHAQRAWEADGSRGPL